MGIDSLFDSPRDDQGREKLPDSAPLAARVRPQGLDGFVGQSHLLEPGSPLREAVDRGVPHSMILYGPPGTGKTTLARIVATSCDAAFEELSAVEVGRADVRKVISEARDRKKLSGRNTILFLDEIHRFNKAQQDALLPAVEDGTLTLIGATTENPYFEVNSALISRMAIYELNALGSKEIETVLCHALNSQYSERAEISPEALEYLSRRCGGDARAALAGLELAFASAGDDLPTLKQVESALAKTAITYDAHADQHHDYISAWIKSTRGSNVDASLYYLAVMLEGGEDPRFIARRMVILASEDIGIADPNALPIAVAAAHAVDRVGLPECQYALAHAAVYLSRAPKSNAIKAAISAARTHVRTHGAQTPPSYLREGSYKGAEALGRGQGYVYPPSQPGGASDQELMPEGLEDVRFFPDEAPQDREGRE